MCSCSGGVCLYLAGIQDTSDLFQQVLLFDGFSAKIPQATKKELEKFLANGSSLLKNQHQGQLQNSSQKFVRGKSAQFSECVASKHWTAQDETLLRLSFWGNNLCQESGKDLQDQMPVNALNASDKLFVQRFLAINEKYK